MSTTQYDDDVTADLGGSFLKQSDFDRDPGDYLRHHPRGENPFRREERTAR